MTAQSPPPNRWRISNSARGTRLDAYLAEAYDVSRARAAAWIRDGRVALGDRTVKPGLKLRGGEWVSCEPAPPAADDRVQPEPGPLVVLFEDPDLVVLDKPAGLVVHPGAGRPGGTLVNRLVAAYPEIAAVGGSGRPGIVHRLDAGTSGVMVTARSATAFEALSRAFAERRVSKRYLTIVFGCPDVNEGSIQAPIGRHRFRRKEMAVTSRGREAETRYRVLASAGELSLVEAVPISGRTHQIRVHLRHLGHPILADPVYGESRWRSLPKKKALAAERLDRPALHAQEVAFEHPRTGTAVSFTAPFPAALAEVWQRMTGTDVERLAAHLDVAFEEGSIGDHDPG